MGGNLAMSVTCHGLPVGSCEQDENEYCQRFAKAFVHAAAGVVAGVKPIALFSCAARDAEHGGCTFDKALELLEVYTRVLPHYGVALEIIESVQARPMLLAWRRDLVADILSDKIREEFLSAFGYDTSSPEALIDGLCMRLERYYNMAESEFPHEIGLVFGYPVDDVIGFMNKGKATCHGPWISYGDPAVARERFSLFSKGEEAYRMRFETGVSLASLIMNS